MNSSNVVSQVPDADNSVGLAARGEVVTVLRKVQVVNASLINKFIIILISYYSTRYYCILCGPLGFLADCHQ